MGKSRKTIKEPALIILNTKIDMKLLTLISLISTILFIPSSSESEELSDLEAAIKEKTTEIVTLAKSKDANAIERQLRAVKGVKETRHHATPARIVAVFEGIRVKDLKFSGFAYHPEKNLIRIRIVEPIRMDLEYYFNKKEGVGPVLQSFHP